MRLIFDLLFKCVKTGIVTFLRAYIEALMIYSTICLRCQFFFRLFFFALGAAMTHVERVNKRAGQRETERERIVFIDFYFRQIRWQITRQKYWQFD